MVNKIACKYCGNTRFARTLRESGGIYEMRDLGKHGVVDDLVDGDEYGHYTYKCTKCKKRVEGY